MLTWLIAILSTLSTCAFALRTVGIATIENRCPYDVYAWSVTPLSGGTAKKITKNGGLYTEVFQRPCANCGVSIKISKNSANPTDITQYEYSIANNQLWYDISFIDCAKAIAGSDSFDATACPGHEGGVSLGTVTAQQGGGGKFGASKVMTGCETLKCGPGEYCPYNAYYVPVPGNYQPVRACAPGQYNGELRMVLCSDTGIGRV